MIRTFLTGAAAGLVLSLGVLATAEAQQAAPAAAPKKAAQSAPKAGPGEKVCRHKFPSGEQRAWVCKQDEPCCAWDAINYVKCGSPTFKCL
jgi:hypothetical protein